MTDLMVHRGPDGEGFALSWVESGGFQHDFVRHTAKWDARVSVRVALGHRRLAILDLSERGLQPMSSRDRRTWIVFNGEIYNYLALRSELAARGCAFMTQTDTEVLLQAYLHWGEACLERLEGMYAFAVWDSLEGRLFCARDRLGIKPFYYANAAGYFIFASEIKSLLAFPGLDAVAEDNGVLEFLVHGNCDYGEITTLRSIKALPAAHSLSLDIETQRISLRRYWQLELRSQNNAGNDEQIAHLKELLLETIGKHLISDVRIGSCLSGGLDSSTIVALVGKIRREQPEIASAIGDKFYTFTSCYEYPEFDEREYALMVADSVRAEPQLVFPTPEDFLADFERMAWHQDMPFGSLSVYAQWRVMRAAKERGIKVLLDGQGGDEVFGGYAKFRYAYFVSLLHAGQIARLLTELGATVRQGDRYTLGVGKGYRYLPRLVRSILKTDSLLKNVIGTNWDQVISRESSPATRWWRHTFGRRGNESSLTILRQIQIDDIVGDTLPQLLRFEDRSSMAFSLEARVPLLDHKLVVYGLSLPDHLKFQNGWSKFAIRQAMRGLMPDEIRLRRTKLGFEAPDRRWLCGELRTCVSDLIESDLLCRKYVEPRVLRRWFNSARARTARTGSYLGLFRILSLEMWMRAFNVSTS